MEVFLLEIVIHFRMRLPSMEILQRIKWAISYQICHQQQYTAVNKKY